MKIVDSDPFDKVMMCFNDLEDSTTYRPQPKTISPDNKTTAFSTSATTKSTIASNIEHKSSTIRTADPDTIKSK